MDTLTVNQAPSVNGFSVGTTARVIKLQFGDGYRQTAADGLNAAPDTIQIGWTALPIATALAVKAFLKAHVGLPFLFLPPYETVPRCFDCEQWTLTGPAGGYASITLTLNERFDPH